MNIKELIKNNRSYRRFHQDQSVDRSTLEELVDLARLSASAANLQPLKFFLSHEEKNNKLIFAHLGWAAYLKNWPGPAEGERPAAYILILQDNTIARNIDCDHGIAAQSILLGATEKGLGGCILGSIQRKRLAAALDLPERYQILLTIALGAPAETVRVVDLPEDGSIYYWRDEEEIHHVPKRKLTELIINP